MKKILTGIFCIMISLSALAQQGNILSAARLELDKRNLTETEVRERLLEEGIDVDTIPQSQYAQYQTRIMRILNQMQAEKNAGVAKVRQELRQTQQSRQIQQTRERWQVDGNGQIRQTAEQELEVLEENPVEAPTVSPASEISRTTLGEAAAESTLQQNLQSKPAEASTVYGHSLFNGKTLDVFRTTDGAQAPDTYILGEGDEVHISIFGASQTEIHQRISPDGSIQPTGSTKIFLKGMTLAQARTAIRSKLSSHYSFRPDQIVVTISTARTLHLNIYGEVGVQGGFTVSALNTVFNALAAAGGPTAIGSVRNIQLSRAGKTQRLDLYKFMTNPTDGSFYDLQNNDVIFVPVAQKIVSIEGAVYRPMRYEMIEGETLTDLIGYAGGVTDQAYSDYMQIERLEDGQKKILEYSLNNVINGMNKVALMPGDIVRILSSDIPLENYVAVGGDIYYAGRFDLENNRSLQKLLENAKPRYTARTDVVLVERVKADETREVFTVPFPGLQGQPDFRLEARDSVTVLQLTAYRDVDSLKVMGQVRKPFARVFGQNDRMTVSQAIEYADGLKSSVYPVAYIFRKDISNPVRMEYLPINLEKDGDTLLQPGDELNIYDNSTYTNLGEIGVSGAVKQPLRLGFSPALTVHDLITMAGGFEVGAAPDRVEVFRVDLDKPQTVYRLCSLAVDEDYNPVDTDFQLQPYDHLVVRQKPNFSQGRKVEINGRVKYPGVYILSDSNTQLSQILEMAGGLSDDASPYCTLFREHNGRGSIGVNLKEAMRHKKQARFDPYLMDGDILNIVREENTVTIRETGTLMGQYVPDDFLSGEKTFIYQGPHSAKWYIRHFAGGFQKNADRNSVTVTTPDNQSEGIHHFLGFRIYPKVQPGSVITLSMDQQKVEQAEKPKEKVEWDKVAASTLSAITSVVSIILLIERLN